MMRNSKIIVFTLLILLFAGLLNGCKTPKQMASEEELMERMEHAAYFESVLGDSFRYDDLNIKTNIRIEMPDRSMSARATLKVAKDSALSVSIVAPILGEIFQVILTPDSISVIDRYKRRYAREDYRDLLEETGLKFNFYSIQSLFTNRIFLPGTSRIGVRDFDRFKLEQGETRAIASVQEPRGIRYAFTTNARNQLLTTFITEPNGKMQVDWQYDDFKPVDGQQFPMSMLVAISLDEKPVGTLEMSISGMERNTGSSIRFQVTSRYTEMSLKQLLESYLGKKK